MVLSFSLIIITLIAMILFDKELNDLRTGLIVAAVFISGYLLRRNFVSGTTEWKVDNNGIAIKWTKKIPFAGYKDLNIRWTELKSIGTRVSARSHTLNIQFISGSFLSFYHDDYVRKDDFENLVRALNEYCK